MKKIVLFTLGCACASAAFALDLVSSADGGGAINATPILQREIDRVSAAGGGRLTLKKGDYVVAALRLKSGVELHLEKDATLLGSTNRTDYGTLHDGIENEPGKQNTAVIWAQDAENIALTGEGSIDGRGWFPQYGGRRLFRWRNIYLYRVKGLRIEGLAIRNSSMWTCFLRECEEVFVRRLTIRGHANCNDDGLDLTVRNAVIEDCDISTDDDALVFKNHNPAFVSENVEVKNCRFSSNACCVKTGSETLGRFRNINIHDCWIGFRESSRMRKDVGRFPGVTSPDTSATGLAFSIVDGGSIENLTVRNITMGEGLQVPFLVRLGSRFKRADGGESYIRNVLFESIRMTKPTTSWISSSITGVPGLRPSDITFRDIDLVLKGGGSADEISKKPPENPADYPSAYLTFKSMLPSHAFYLRHVDKISFENINIRLTGDPEPRPAIVADDVTGIRFSGCPFSRNVLLRD